MNSRMMRIGRNELTYDRVIPVEEIMDKIISVTLDDIAQVTEHLFGRDEYAMATVGPFTKDGATGVGEEEDGGVEAAQ